MKYTIEVENVGPESALDITITDELTGGMVLGQIVTSQGVCSETAGLISCNLDDLEPGASAQIQIVVIPDPQLLGEIAVHEATVKSSRFDPITFNNSANSTVQIPALSEVGMIAMAGVLATISLVRVVRNTRQLWKHGLRKSGRLDSNQRPPAPHAGALPSCATPRSASG